MKERLTISVDAMGGDNAPKMVIAGINIVRQRLSDVDFLLFGDEKQLAPLLDGFPKVKDACRIHHTDAVVDNDTKVSAALRGGQDTSMRLAIDAVAKGEAQGVISAGNTGALMAMAKFVLKTLPGVSRPAIASTFPTRRGETVMLDLGANVDCDADNLVQFAVMGEVFARHVLGLDQPTIGILNVGVEGFKGNEAVREASRILSESSLPIKFHGFVEGDGLALGTVDVIVTDGFTGNIALKTTEGTVRMFSHYLKGALNESPRARLGALLAAPALRKFRMTLDPRRHNGAMMLGLNGICVKSHGGTDSLGFANAAGVASDLVRRGFNEKIKEDLERLISGPANAGAAIV